MRKEGLADSIAKYTLLSVAGFFALLLVGKLLFDLVGKPFGDITQELNRLAITHQLVEKKIPGKTIWYIEIKK